MGISKLNNGERTAGGSALLLFALMFLQWYGLRVVERPNLLFELNLFQDGGNAWQTIELTSIVLALVIAITVGALIWRLISHGQRSPVFLGKTIFIAGLFAVCLILIRIAFPPDLGGEVEGFTFEVTLQVGIFLSLTAACGIAFGRGWAM